MFLVCPIHIFLVSLTPFSHIYASHEKCLLTLSCLSVCLSALVSSAPMGQVFAKFGIGVLNKNSVKTLQIWLKSDKNIGHFTQRPQNTYIFDSCMKYFFFPMVLRPNAGHGLLILEVPRSHTTTHHSRQDSSGRVIGSSQRPLPDSTQHLQLTNIRAPRWDPNPRSQKSSSRRPTPQTARPLGPA